MSYYGHGNCHNPYPFLYTLSTRWNGYESGVQNDSGYVVSVLKHFLGIAFPTKVLRYLCILTC